MFNKIIKRSHRKTSKSDSVEAQTHINCGQESTNVTVNHASRTSEANPSTVSSQPPSLSLAALPSSGAVEILPSLRDATPADRPGLFLRKLQICCVFFDFSSTLKSVREKEIKRQTLAELVELVQSGSAKMSEWMQQEMVSMIAINLFRCLPPASYENTGCEVVDPEEDEPYLDPSWPHLQLLYDLLLKYVVSAETDNKVAKRYIDHVFVLRLLNLFDSEDPREREYLKTILHRIYGKFMVHRPFIRTAISNVFYRFIFETERHSGIGELLEILGSIINGFALPMKQEHKLFLIRALIPLHKPKAMSSYHQQLSYCVIQFVEKDYRLADVVIRGLLKYWPITNCQKEILFLGELEEVLEGTHSAEFQCCIVPLFRQIGRCLNSPHFQMVGFERRAEEGEDNLIVSEMENFCTKDAVELNKISNKLGIVGRKRLADISNCQNQVKASDDVENSKCTKECVDKIVKENMALMQLLADRNKLIEISGLELRKLRINLEKVQQQNLQLARSNTQMLMELNSGKDCLKSLRHELGCKIGLLQAKNMQGVDQKKKTSDDNELKTLRSKNQEGLQGNTSDDDRPCSTSMIYNHRNQSKDPFTSEKDPVECKGRKRSYLRRQSCKFKVDPECEDSFEIDNDRFAVSSVHDVQGDSLSTEDSLFKEEETGNPLDAEAPVLRRSSIGRPLRRAAEKIQSYKEPSLNSKMRRT